MELERERDVIIVGAGPAGATTATVLAQQGLDVLLLDRHDFPRDKACGDGIPAGAIDLMTRLGMGEKIKQAVQRGEF
jgi:flavin-dependent dehydrogenase